MSTPNPQHVLRVGLIEDRPLIRLGIERLLENEGSCRVCWNSVTLEEACASVEKDLPDVVLIDARRVLAFGEEVARLSARVAMLVILDEPDARLQDLVMLAGARGIIDLSDREELILRAIAAVHAGELWIDRASAHRMLDALSRKDRRTPSEAFRSSLTTRERDVMKAVVTRPGLSAKRIAGSMQVSESTLRNHLTSIYGKLGVSGRVELFAFAHRHGWHE
jgi:two-component system nitrate/nitrite response regulator NarL